jgi:transcriptional regulator with XRE-family HTH domain
MLKDLRRYGTAASISQAEFAVRMAVDRPYISDLEDEARIPTVLALRHTALALGVDVSYLLINEKRKTARKGLGQTRGL